MNRYDWNNPPPPGTEYEFPDEESNFSSQKSESTRSSDQGINRNDPSPKSPVVQSREIKLPPENTRYRSRSKSPDRRKRRRRSRSYSRRSRSNSRDRHRRSRSRSRYRRRKYSSSRSRSRSPSYRHRYRRHNRYNSRSRSRSLTRKGRSYRCRTRSRSHSRSRSYRSDRERRSPRYHRRISNYAERIVDEDVIGEEDMKIEGPDEEPAVERESESDQAPIPFKNDGSFLEIFKKMQEQQKANEEPPQEAAPKKPVLPAFGKRRGGKVLKTGMVAKVRNTEEDTNSAQDAWSVYMKEVRKYKEVHCDDDSKTRPLVK